MPKKAEFIFVGDAESVIKAAKATQAALAKTASEAEGSSRKTSAANTRTAKSAEQAGHQIEGAHVRVRKSFAGMTASAAKMGAGVVAAYASIEGAKKAVEATETLAHSTLTLNKSFGLTVHTASEWAAVAQARGTDGKALTMGFKALSTATHAASEGGKAQVKAFGELGISHKELQKHGADLNWVLHSVADGLKDMPVGTDKAALSAKLFGRTWTTIAPLVRNGSDALDEQLQLADKYGATFSEKGVGSLEEFIKAQREAKLATLGLQIAFGTQLAPALTKVIKAGANFAAQMRDGTGAGGKFAAKAKEIWAQLQPLRDVIASTGKFLAAHPRLILAVVAAFAGFKIVTTVVAAFKSLRVAALALNLALEANPVGAVVLAIAALGAGLVIAYRNSETFRKVMNRSLQLVTNAVDFLAGGVSSLFRLMGHAPGMGWATKAADEIDRARKATRQWVDNLNKVPGNKTVVIKMKAERSGGKLTITDFINPNDLPNLNVKVKDPLSGTLSSHMGKAAGGIVPGTGSGDIVPAMLEPGEFIIRKKVVDRFGPTFFAGINGGMGQPQAKGYSDGGIVARANAIDGKHYPYVWGGGHSRTGVPDGGTGRDPGTGYDCSGAVSAILGVSPPRVSGGFESWGSPGPGAPMDTKVYANATHVFAVLNGRGWGTSRENPGGGAGWLSYNSRSGFTVRHTSDAGGANAGSGVGNPQETVESGKQRKTAAAQKQGSRIVNKIIAGTSKAVRSATGRAAAIGGVIDEADSGYGRTERLYGQVLGGVPGKFGEEDLGTAAGRGQRTTELQQLRSLKKDQLARMRKRMADLSRAIAARTKTLKSLRRARDKAKGSKRAKIIERIKPYEDRTIELQAELAALGGQISDTELDVGDLDKELADVAATPDTAADAAAQDAGPSTTDKVSSALAHIAALERAGDITPEQSHNAQIQTLQDAIGGRFGALTDEEALNLRGDLKEATSALTQATVDNTQAILDNTASNNALLAYADRVSAITSLQAVRAMADVVSNQLGTRVAARSAMPGSGALSRL